MTGKETRRARGGEEESKRPRGDTNDVKTSDEKGRDEEEYEREMMRKIREEVDEGMRDDER